MKLRLAICAAILAACTVGIAQSPVSTASEERPLPVPTTPEDLPEWRPFIGPIEGPDGVQHDDCKILVKDPASLIVCADGYTEES